MLGDRFPPSRLGFATSVYYAGIPVGFACSLALAGWLVPRFGWRACFYLLGVLGLAAVAPVWRMADPPRRGARRRGGRRGRGAARRSRAGCAARSPPSPRSRLLIAGATLLVVRERRPRSTSSPGSCRSAASPTRARRTSRRRWSSGRGSPAASRSARSPTRRSAAGRAGGSSPSSLLGGLSLAATAAFYLLPAASPFFLAAWLVAQAWTLGWFGPMLAAIHERAPAGSRATVIGFGLMTINLVGVGAGPWVTGAIGDRAGLTTGLLASVGVGRSASPSSAWSPCGSHNSRPDPVVLRSRDTPGGTMGANNRIRKFVKPYRVDDGKKFRLKDHDPADSNGLDSKEKAEKLLAKGVERLAELQDKLYAQDKWAVLLIFQAMDAAGKDGAIKHVMSGINPQGCQVYSFKSPTSEELDHDFLWRTAKSLPERGRIGIFNRSYYEEVLVVRVHPEFLEKQKLRKLITKRVWKERYEEIAAHERYLARNGVVVSSSS